MKPTQAQTDLLQALRSTPFYMDEGDWERLVASCSGCAGRIPG